MFYRAKDIYQISSAAASISNQEYFSGTSEPPQWVGHKTADFEVFLPGICSQWYYWDMLSKSCLGNAGSRRLKWKLSMSIQTKYNALFLVAELGGKCAFPTISTGLWDVWLFTRTIYSTCGPGVKRKYLPNVGQQIYPNKCIFHYCALSERCLQWQRINKLTHNHFPL